MQEIKGLEVSVLNSFSIEIEQWNSRFCLNASKTPKTGYCLLMKFCWNILRGKKIIKGLLK